MQPSQPIRQRDGQYLCTIDAQCQEPAVVQAAYPCEGCDQYVAELTARVQAKQQVVDAKRNVLEQLLEQIQGEKRAPSLAESAIAALCTDELAAAGAELEQLRADIGRHDDVHTHPLFACQEHGQDAGLISTD